MMRKILQMKVLHFTIFSNDLHRGIIRFRLPSVIIPLFMFVFITLMFLLIYYIHESKQLKQENELLVQEVDEKDLKNHQLYTEIAQLRETEHEVRSQLETLYELESQVKESMEDLPVDIEPSGGIDLELSESEIMQLKEEKENLTNRTEHLIDRYRKTISTLEKTNDELRNIPTEWPVKQDKITSKYGVRTDPFRKTSTFHTGVDIRGNLGDIVYATADGQVIQAEHTGGHGNLIVIKHSDTYETWYAHLSQMDVSKGDKVKKGEQIGKVGSTGRSTGPHLHYEIIENGEPIDPYTYLSIYDQYEEGK